MKILLLVATLAFAQTVSAFAPGGAIKAGKVKNDPNSIHNGVVTKTMTTGQYTYVLVKGKKESLWAAGPKTTVKNGDKVEFLRGLAMKNFYSKTLKMNFETVYFTNYLLVNGTPAQSVSKKKTVLKINKVTKVKKADYSINEIYKNSNKLSNKNIKVRGQVVKVSKQIMGLNWLHIQDGTGKDGTHDLVVTTKDLAKTGDRVLISAKVITKKDFGHGYAYDVLLQEAKVTVEK